MKMYIQLENLVFYSYHGVLPQETIVGNEYIVNLKIAFDMSHAFESDSVDDTINYAKVYEVVKKEMEIPSKLIEHAAYRVVSRLNISYPQITGLELKLSKRNPPVGAQLENASVILIDGEL